MIQIASGALGWNQGSGLKCKTLGFHPWVGKIPWRREWLPTPVFLSGESHGQRSLADYSPWGRKELDTAEWLTLSLLLSRLWEPKLCAVSYHTTVWPLSFSSLAPGRQFQVEGASLGGRYLCVVMGSQVILSGYSLSIFPVLVAVGHYCLPTETFRSAVSLEELSLQLLILKCLKLSILMHCPGDQGRYWRIDMAFRITRSLRTMPGD